MKLGLVFQLVGQDYHIHIVISEPLRNRVLVCNLTDKNKCPDSPCFFNVGDHEWITKESGVAIRFLYTLPCSGYGLAIKSSDVRFSKNLFPIKKVEMIRTGLMEMISVSEAWKEYLE